MPFTIATDGLLIILAIHTRATIAARVRLRAWHGCIRGSVTSITVVTIGAFACRIASHAVGSHHVVLAIHARSSDARVIPSCSCARYGWVCGSFTSSPRPQGVVIALARRRRSLIRIGMRRLSSVITEVCTLPGSQCTTIGMIRMIIIRFTIAVTPSIIAYITAHGCCMIVAIICHGTNIMVNLTAWPAEAWFTSATATLVSISGYS